MHNYDKNRCVEHKRAITQHKLFEKIIRESEAEDVEYRKIAAQFVKASLKCSWECFDIQGPDPSVLFEEVADKTGRDYDDIKDENWDIDLDVPEYEVVDLICKYHLLDVGRLKKLEVECGKTLEKDGRDFVDEAYEYDEDFFCEIWKTIDEDLKDVKDNFFREIKEEIISEYYALDDDEDDD